MTGYNPDQQPKCGLTESAFRDDKLRQQASVWGQCDISSGQAEGARVADQMRRDTKVAKLREGGACWNGDPRETSA